MVPLGETMPATPTIGILTGFIVSPHTPEMISVAANEAYAKSIQNKLYAYNDKSAVCVVDGQIEIINDGQYWEFN